MIYTEKFEKNKEKIIEIVSKNFGYTDKSVDKFIEGYNKKFENLDEVFLKFFDENDKDLKKVVKIEDNIYEKIDKGFIYFYYLFPSFCNEYNINYSNFRDWRIVVNKNFIKMRKMLVSFYTNWDNHKKTYLDIFRVNNYESFLNWLERGNSYFETRKKKIVELIDEQVESVGTKKLPNKDLYAVLTFDFADWMLCSTAESWSSCLNLESDFGGCFWHGLPSTCLDKNRLMVYLTDKEVKNYNNILSEKIISRNWGLLTNEDKIAMIKAYPNPILDENSLNIIFNTDIFVKGSGTNGIKKSKYSLNKTSLEIKGGFCDFIYVDDTKIGSSDGHLYIGSENGGSHYVKLIEDKWTQETLFSYNGGLSNLISIEKNINQVGGNRFFYSCYECNKDLNGNNRNYFNYNGHKYCNSCKKKMFELCVSCGSAHPKDKIIIYNDKKLCESCFKTLYFKCSCCDEIYENKHKKHTIGNKDVCEKCSFFVIAKCAECESIIFSSDYIDDGENVYCKDCAKGKKLTLPCSACGIYHEKNKMEFFPSIFGETRDEYFCKTCLRAIEKTKQYYLELFEE